MKTFSIKRAFFAMLIVFASLSFSSCNRGVGCPTNFSMNDIVETLVDQIDLTEVVKDVFK